MNVLSEYRCTIGEGPIWNVLDQKLYHVNGYENEIIEIDPDIGAVKVHKLDFGVAAIAFSNKGEMLISCADGAFVLHPDHTRKLLYDPAKYEIKYGNDAKVGPDGRFYVGTQSGKRMGVSPNVDGKLYCIDPDGTVKVVLDGLILSNGFDWSIDEKRFYHTDSDTRIIKEYDFNKSSGELSFTGRQVQVDGADGFTIDEKDFLYVACWGRGHIAVVDTRDMKIKDYIPVPTRIPASCCFAGQNMDQLVVVTAAYHLSAAEYPTAGCTFRKNVGTKGRKPYLFGK